MPNWAIHILADIVVAGIVSAVFPKYRKDFKKIALILISTNLMDVDHLLAEPIYDPQRCGINFHPLHSWYMFPVYAGGLFTERTRWFSIGIIMHLILDGFDCIV
jgi:hypothetical protein